MPNRWKKLALGVTVAACAVAYLFWSGLSSAMVSTRTVGEFLDSPRGRSRVTGQVKEASVGRLADGALLFVLEEGGREVRVVYRDPVPDMFAEGRPVIVEGTLADDGVFQADTLLTKCPSKYEAVPEGHPGGEVEGVASSPPAV